MKLSTEQISESYQCCYEYTSNILQKNIKLRGYDSLTENPEIIDLIQSVVGHESIVELLQQVPFSTTKYNQPIQSAINEVKKILFPDVSKKRYISINDERYGFVGNSFVAKNNQQETTDAKISLDIIYDLLANDLWEYFTNKLLVNHPQILNSVIRIPDSKKEIETFKKQLNNKVYLFQKFYPDGKIDIKDSIDVSKSLNKNQIINVYLKVYLDIEKFFPKNFLQKNVEKRSAILVRFLIEEILESQPNKILEQKDETLFIKHKLQNVYRYFNYSFNRVLGNAYPEIIHPWLRSRASTEYWENKNNRINAVKWLVEERLNFLPNTLFKAKISRKDFANNGLSFLFNNYYNSVSSALAETYPEKNLWEFGNVPFSFWNENNNVRAIHWLIEMQGWKVNELPYWFQAKEFNRKTFSEFGLATLFEKKFNKNIYSAVSLAYPNMFYPWEFGKVPSIYWKNHLNIFHASTWIANREGIEEKDIVHSIREGELNFRILEKYSIGQVLRKKSDGKIENLFGTHFWKEHSAYLNEKRILRKIKNQEKRFVRLKFIRILLYGFFAKEVAKVHFRQQNVYRRISQRISNNNIF
jgi:hypothetical protein